MHKKQVKIPGPKREGPMGILSKVWGKDAETNLGVSRDSR